MIKILFLAVGMFTPKMSKFRVNKGESFIAKIDKSLVN